MNKTDIEKIKSLPIEEVARRLQLNVVRHKCRCPFHDDTHPSLTFKAGTFRCFACGAHGDVISLAQKLLNLSFVETCHWLAQEGNLILHSSSDTRPAQPMDSGQPAPFDAARYVRYFDHPWLSGVARRFLFDERAIDPRVAGWCRLSSYRDKHNTHWLQIPYFDQQGQLIGIQSRNLSGQQPRFRFPKGSRCTIYNLPVLPLLREGEPLYIAEGASDCWAMLSAGHKAIAIPSATLLKPHQLRQALQLIAHHQPLQLHIYPDNDTPGENLYRKLLLVANDIGASLQRHPLPAGCKDFADYYVKTHLRQPKH